jgi:PAS domain S-box-containing protein
MQMLKHLSAQSLFDALPDAAIILDRSCCIRYMNSSAHLLFQYNLDEVKGQPIEVLIPARFRIRHIADRENLLRGGAVAGWSSDRKLMALRKDGNERSVLVRLSTLTIDHVPWLICSIRDFSAVDELDQKASELELHLQNMTWVLEASAAFKPEQQLDAASLKAFHERMAALCLNIPLCPSPMIPVKMLLEQTRRLSQPHFERVAADLFIEEFGADVALHCQPALLQMALLGFLILCTEAVAGLGERWVKIGLEPDSEALFLSLNDSASVWPQGRERVHALGVALLEYAGATLVTRPAHPSRLSFKVPQQRSS